MTGQVIQLPETREHRWERWRRIQVGLINGRQPETWADRFFHDAYPETQEFLAMHARALAKGQTDHVVYASHEDEQP